MSGRLYLGGGGAEKVAFEVEDNFFKDVNSVLYIPLAWPNDNLEGCLKWFSGMASLHKKLKIEMWADTKNPLNLDKFDSVYIGGGNTFKLLKRLRESKAEKKLIDFYKKGGKIFGGSAGAIIWGKSIITALICKDKDKNEVKLKNTKGFNQVLGCDIQCHFERNQIKEHQEYIKKTGRNVIGIPKETAIIVENSKLKVIGAKPITIMKKDNFQNFPVGSQITLK